jgi:hypothetical protein
MKFTAKHLPSRLREGIEGRACRSRTRLAGQPLPLTPSRKREGER